MNENSPKLETTSVNPIALALATGLGFGMSPVMPGTVGTVLGLPICWGLESIGTRPVPQIVASVVLLLIGIPICSVGERHFGKKDPGAVVFDEIAALPLLYIFVPFTWLSGLVGFIWFRVFDIAKPWPIKHFERVEGGLGIMIDDTVAAVMAAVATYFTMQFLN